MRKKINVGVVGCGYWGPNLIRNFASLPECHLQSVCDSNEGRLALIAKQYPSAETYGSFEIFLNDEELDAVVIAVPVRFHFDLAMRSLMAGKHTFIEKPMAASVEECEKLIAVAAENNLTLMVGHTFLYSPAVRKIKEIVDSGELGRIQYISCRRLNLGLYQKDINVAWDLAPHDLSIILYLIGAQPTEVNCRGKMNYTAPDGILQNRQNSEANSADVSNMTLLFENGCFATVHNSWLDPLKVRDMTIVGDHKMIVYDDLKDSEKIKIYDKRVDPPYLPHESRISYHYGDTRSPYVTPMEPLRVEAAHFIECIITEKKPLSDGEAGLQVVKILTLASESMMDNGNGILIDDRQRECKGVGLCPEET